MSVPVGLEPQVSKFEQVSSNNHQISLAAGRFHISNDDKKMSVAGGVCS